eukprot:UN10900
MYKNWVSNRKLFGSKIGQKLFFKSGVYRNRCYGNTAPKRTSIFFSIGFLFAKIAALNEISPTTLSSILPVVVQDFN